MIKNKKEIHSKLIDEYDLERISKKSHELAKIIAWLEKLKKLDPDTDAADVNLVIQHIKAKKAKLDLKAKEAINDLVEEAELLADAYTN